jgi:transposase
MTPGEAMKNEGRAGSAGLRRVVKWMDCVLIPCHRRTLPMRFAGVDLHAETITIAVVDAARKVCSRKRFSNRQSDEMRQFLSSHAPFDLTVEATASYEWFVQLVEPLARRVVLAHPGRLRIIAESTRKSDKLDATILAEMLALDQVPSAYRPTPRQREHRALVRHRHYLKQQITKTKNKIRRILGHYNQDRRDLFTKLGQLYLKEVQLSAADRFCLDQINDQRIALTAQVAEAERRLTSFADEGSPQEKKDRETLRSIPGMGFVITEVMLAELADPRRFSSEKEVAAYAGLVPGQRESAGKRKSLHIEKTGSALLRWAVVQGAWQLVRRSPRWHAIYTRLKTRLGGKKAIIAVARRLLGLAFGLLKKQEKYRELPFATASSVATPSPTEVAMT